MTNSKFTQELKDIFRYIQQTLLAKYDTDTVSKDYFILSVLDNEKSVGYRILSKIMLHDVLEDIREHFLQNVSSKPQQTSLLKRYDEAIEQAISDAGVLSARQKSSTINSGHVLCTLIRNDQELVQYFRNIGVTVSQINTQLAEETKDFEGGRKEGSDAQSVPQRHVRKQSRQAKQEPPKDDTAMKAQMPVPGGECEKVTVNLNAMAYESRIEPIYGNADIYESIFNVLSKRNKNNAVIVGRPGVGKSDTVRNLANLIASGDVPRPFRRKVLLEVDINALFYGTQMRGTFEAKMKAVQNEIRQNGDFIFFIDAIDTATSKNFSQNDVCDFIEMLMKERNAMLICTCSDKDYQKTIGDIPSWGRYFEKIEMHEPSDVDCEEILRQHVSRLEVFHDVAYSDDVYGSTMRLCRRYMTDRCLPDSAIDVLDKAGAKKCLADCEGDDTETYRKMLLDVRGRMSEMRRNHTEGDSAEYDSLTKQEIELSTALDNSIKAHNISRERDSVTSDDIRLCVSEMTGVPVTKLSESDRDRLRNLEERIKASVVGQDDAVDSVCRAIKRQRVGIGNPGKPVVFLMAGSTGVGKSYLAKVIAREVFGDEKKMVRLDMAEYADKTSITKLIGSGSGYVGFESGGILTEAIKKNRHCVLLLDEIEKANDEVHNAFLSMFDEGRMTDNKGITVDFSNVIVVMTSNVGAREADERGSGIGFAADASEMRKDIIEKEMKRRFKPEFINRIDKIVFFNRLTDDDIRHIISLELAKVRVRLEQMGYGLQDDMEGTQIFNTIYEGVASHRSMGARPVIREIQSCVEDRVTDMIIDGNVEDGHVFTSDELCG